MSGGDHQGIEQTLADRGERYGAFTARAAVAQAIKAAIATGPNWPALAPDQREALDMIAHKISRIVSGDPDYHDSWHDIAGYATLVADRLLAAAPVLDLGEESFPAACTNVQPAASMLPVDRPKASLWPSFPHHRTLAEFGETGA